MADQPPPDNIPELQADGDRPDNPRRHCPVCAGSDVVRLGHPFRGIDYIPAANEDSFFSLGHRLGTELYACLDCGFVDWFLNRAALDQLRRQRGR